METQSNNGNLQVDWTDQSRLADFTSGAGYAQLINSDNIENPSLLIDNGLWTSQAEDSSGASLQGQSLSSIGTTNTYSTNTTQSTSEDVSQLLQASQPLPFSFQRQTSVLRKIYTPMQFCEDVQEIGKQIGLQRHEIFTWFEVEKNRRATWSLPSKLFNLPRSRPPPVELRTSVPFLEQVWLLRESFDLNQWPSNNEYLRLSRETCIDAIDVMLWFDAERGIQLQCLQPIPAYVPGFSMVEAAHESTHRGGVDVPFPILHGPAFDIPETGEHSSRYSMEQPQSVLEVRLTKGTTSCLGKRTMDFGRTTIDGPFPCLFCKKDFPTIAYWRNHQTKVHFSEKIYECWENKMDGSPCLYGPVLRADNLRTHLVKEHQHQKGRELIKKVNDRARIVSNLYHDKCGFSSCHLDLADFKTSMDHIAEHLSSGRTVSEWTHVCQSTKHRIPPHSKQDSCQNTMQSNGHDDNDDNDDDDDDDNDGDDNHRRDNNDGQGYDQCNHGFNNGRQRSHGFSSNCNRGTPSTTRRDQAQESDEGSDVVTELSDHNCNTHSPSIATPSAHGMTNDIAVISIEGSLSSTNIKPFPVPGTFNMDNYFRRIRFLGRGSLGFVEKVVSVASNKIYARKTIRRSQLSFEDPEDVESLNQELENLKFLRHSHLVRLIDVYASSDYIYIFMSPVADGNLSTFFHASQNGALSQYPTKQKHLLLEWMSCLQSAMAYLHSQNVVHEDLKPENILVKENTIFLTNIKDLKQFTDQDSVEVTGLDARSMYCAPETIVYGILNAKSNSFSLGCVFSEMLTIYFDKPLSDFQSFRACGAVTVPYHANLEQTNKWIDLLTVNLILPDSALDFSLLFVAVHTMLIESSSKRPSIGEIRLGVKDLLQEMTKGRSPEGHSVAETALVVDKFPLRIITEEPSQPSNVSELPLGIKEDSQDKIAQTASGTARRLKLDWEIHFPRMVKLYNSGYTITQIHKAVQCDEFRPSLRAVYERFRIEGYSTGSPRLLRKTVEHDTRQISQNLEDWGFLAAPRQSVSEGSVHDSPFSTLRKFQSLLKRKGSVSTDRQSYNTHVFADRDSGYHSGRGTPSTLSLKLQSESHADLDGLYRIACHRRHEPIFPDEYRDTPPCFICRYSNTHNLASVGKNLAVYEFEEELRLDVYEITTLDAAGNSALHYAAAFGASYSHLNALIDAGVPPYQLNTANQNFFHCLRPHKAGCDGWDPSSAGASLLKLLDRLDRKIMGQQDNDGQTVLHSLASQITEPELREQIFKTFRQLGFPPTTLDRFGKSAKDIRPSTYKYSQTMFAADTFNTVGHPYRDLESSGMSKWEQNVIKQMNACNILIVEAQHNPHYVDGMTKDTVLHALSIVSIQNYEIIQHLRQFVAKGVNLNQHNCDGDHPLASFICNQSFRGNETGATMAKYIDILLWETGKCEDRNDINVNMMSRSGTTALYEAAVRGQSDTVRALIEAGANVNARMNNDPKGQSILQATLAARNQAVLANDGIRMHMFKEVISHLEHAGARLDPTSLEERGRSVLQVLSAEMPPNNNLLSTKP